MSKKSKVKVTEQNGKITLTFNPLEAQKSVRNFDPAGSAPKAHKVKKGKGSYDRKKFKKEGEHSERYVS